MAKTIDDLLSEMAKSGIMPIPRPIILCPNSLKDPRINKIKVARVNKSKEPDCLNIFPASSKYLLKVIFDPDRRTSSGFDICFQESDSRYISILLGNSSTYNFFYETPFLTHNTLYGFSKEFNLREFF